MATPEKLPTGEDTDWAPSWTPELKRQRLHEANWRQHCSWTHKLWCKCGDWTKHVRKTPCTTDDEDGGPVVTFDIAAGDDPATDGILAAAAAEAEATEDATG